MRLCGEKHKLSAQGFYPRTPRGVRRPRAHHHRNMHRFLSTHPSWSATSPSCLWLGNKKFLSTHPSWSATSSPAFEGPEAVVSIHAPLVECDQCMTSCSRTVSGFYPRTPRGVRQVIHVCTSHLSVFLSTHPSWSATVELAGDIATWAVSIHAPLVECDEFLTLSHDIQASFYPRTPRGVRQEITEDYAAEFYVSIHAPLVECDFSLIPRYVFQPVSIHAPLVECDCMFELISKISTVSIHAPLVECDQERTETQVEKAVSIHAPLVECDLWSCLR